MIKYFLPLSITIVGFLSFNSLFKVNAAVCTWDGDTDSNWSTSANWSCGGGPANGDDLIFPSGPSNVTTTNDLTTDTEFNSLLVEHDGYTFTGNDIKLRGDFVFNNDSLNEVNGGVLNFQLNTELYFDYLNIIVTDLGTEVTFSGILEGPSGPDLYKQGDGVLVLNNSNTYSGDTIVQVGFLRLTNSGALQNTAVIIDAGAQIQLSGNINVNTTSLTLNGNGISDAGALLSISGDNVWEGPISIASPSRIGTSGDSLILSGIISGSENLEYTGSGTLRINGTSSNTLTGSFRVLNGTVRLNTTGVAISSTSVIAGDSASGDNSASIILEASDQINASADLQIFSDGLIEVGNNSNNFNNIQIEGGNLDLGTTVIAGEVAMAGGRVRATNLITAEMAGSVWNCSEFNGENAIIEGDPFLLSATTLTITSTSSGDRDCEFISQLQGSTNIVIGGQGIYFAGSNTFTGTVTVNNNSALDIGHANALGNASSGTVVNAGGVLCLADNITVASEALTINGGGNLLRGALCSASGTNIYSGVVTLNGSNDLNISVQGNANLTLNGGIDGTSSGALYFQRFSSGTGVIQLALANTFVTSQINIQDVTVRKTASVNVFPDTLLVDVNQFSTLDLNSFSETVGALAGETGSSVTLGNATLSVGANNNNSTFNGIISGNGSVAKLGTGTTTLTANNTYTGSTNISNGKLNVNGLQSSSNVNLSSTGFLGGTGRVGVITGGGTGGIAPGTSPGILNVTGNVAFASTNNFNVELNSTVLGTGYDQLNVTGSINLNSAILNVTLGFSPSLNNSFTIIQSSGVLIGTFNGLPNGSTFNVGGNTLRIDYGTNSVVLTVTTGGGSGGSGGSNGGGGLANTGVTVPLMALAFLTTTTAIVVMVNKYAVRRKRLHKNSYR
jgi:fibronectin-binding autotransporter adhesin